MSVPALDPVDARAALVRRLRQAFLRGELDQDPAFALTDGDLEALAQLLEGEPPDPPVQREPTPED